MFVYKHTETIEYVKNLPIFFKKLKLYEWLTRQFLYLECEIFKVLFLYEY